MLSIGDEHSLRRFLPQVQKQRATYRPAQLLQVLRAVRVRVREMSVHALCPHSMAIALVAPKRHPVTFELSVKRIENQSTLNNARFFHQIRV